MTWVVDTCIVIDILENDPNFGLRSATLLEAKLDEGLSICPVTFVELAPAFGGNGNEQETFLRQAGIGFRDGWTTADTRTATVSSPAILRTSAGISRICKSSSHNDPPKAGPSRRLPPTDPSPFKNLSVVASAKSDPKSSIINRQSAIGNRQSAIGNRQSAIGKGCIYLFVFDSPFAEFHGRPRTTTAGHPYPFKNPKSTTCPSSRPPKLHAKVEAFLAFVASAK